MTSTLERPARATQAPGKKTEVLGLSAVAIVGTEAGVREFTLRMTVEEVLKNAKVDFFDSRKRVTTGGPYTNGYQRPVTATHVADIATFIATHEDAPWVWTFILAARSPMKFMGREGEGGVGVLSYDKPLFVVDGQHRLDALRIAAAKNPAVMPRTLNVVIVEVLNRAQEAMIFVLHNRTAARARTDLAELVAGYVNASRPVSSLSAPEFESVVCAEAFRWLAEEGASFWHTRLTMPDVAKAQMTFVDGKRTRTIRPTGLKPITQIYHAIQPQLEGKGNVDPETHGAALGHTISEFWHAVERTLPGAADSEMSALTTSTSVFALHRLLITLISDCLVHGIAWPSAEDFYERLRIMPSFQYGAGWEDGTGEGIFAAMGSANSRREAYKMAKALIAEWAMASAANAASDLDADEDAADAADAAAG